mmetsp:Transcript_18086/g.27277  ORF Transcript_18086/g.27277 Transcript_18086/m.27277 type:complete len:252 (+) Transcript_18086:588-1343(+)
MLVMLFMNYDMHFIQLILLMPLTLLYMHQLEFLMHIFIILVLGLVKIIIIISAIMQDMIQNKSKQKKLLIILVFGMRPYKRAVVPQHNLFIYLVQIWQHAVKVVVPLLLVVLVLNWPMHFHRHSHLMLQLFLQQKRHLKLLMLILKHYQKQCVVICHALVLELLWLVVMHHFILVLAFFLVAPPLKQQATLLVISLSMHFCVVRVKLRSILIMLLVLLQDLRLQPLDLYILLVVLISLPDIPPDPPIPILT